MITDAGARLLAIAAGGAVGTLYFAGLWWTVQHATRASRPVLFVAGSFLIRSIVAAALLVGLASGNPWQLLGAMSGFLVVRMVIVRIVRARIPLAQMPPPSSAKG